MGSVPDPKITIHKRINNKIRRWFTLHAYESHDKTYTHSSPERLRFGEFLADIVRFIGSRALALADPYCHIAWNSVGLCVCPQL